MDLRQLDEIAAAATVSPIEADVAGWWCKAAPDLPFRRCNVALPPVDAAADRGRFLAGLGEVRAWYRRHGLRLIVQVSSAMPASDRVDGWLAACGMVVEAPVQVMVVESDVQQDRYLGGSLGRVLVAPGIDAAWAEAYGSLFGGGPVEVARTQAYGRMLVAHGDRALGASCRIDGRTVGVGFGVLDRGWMGVFGMVTAPSHRRQGIARDVLLALRRAAHDRGVDRAYLQVEPDNAAALAVYGSSGFEISHRYHYRSEGLDVDLGR